MNGTRRRWLVRMLLISGLAFGLWRFLTWPDAAYSVAFQPDEEHVVEYVFDGDTIRLANGDRVRLIGVDTPEYADGRPEPFADDAKRFTTALVQGKVVRLKFDRERFDKYRRVLAFVYIDDVSVNEAIVEAGLGRAMTEFGFSSRMKKRLLAAQDRAKQKKLGLWSK